MREGRILTLLRLSPPAWTQQFSFWCGRVLREQKHRKKAQAFSSRRDGSD